MADTGAPWNLPYPLASDLVRDGAQAIQDLAEAAASGLTAAGIVKQVVSTTRTDTFSASVAQGAVSGDAITVTITPTSASSKVLVLAALSVSQDETNVEVYPELYRAGTAIGYRGDAAGSRQRRSTTSGIIPAGDSAGSAPLLFLDSPSVATATTYSVRLGHNGAGTLTVYLNRGNLDDNQTYVARFASTLTVIEVA